MTEISEACPFREAEAEDQDYLQRYPDGYTFFPRPALDAANRETAALLEPERPPPPRG